MDQSVTFRKRVYMAPLKLALVCFSRGNYEVFVWTLHEN